VFTISSPAPNRSGAGLVAGSDVGSGINEIRTRTGNDVREADLLIDVAVPRFITVVYDETCELCRHARRWLEGQKTYVPLQFAAAQDPHTRARFGSVPWLGEELVVVADDGRVWVGPAAFITAMWATKRYRNWSYRLSGDTFSGLARHVFHTITAERGRISGLLRHHQCDGDTCSVGSTVSSAVASAGGSTVSSGVSSTVSSGDWPTTTTAAPQWQPSHPLTIEQRDWLEAAGLLTTQGASEFPSTVSD
jgi:predicted DCC family thiol-disulfide oxidoreductase YuxK